MKRTLTLICVVFLAAGCASMGEDTKTGAIAGGVIGAATGGIIGNQDGHGWEGALIGGAGGALLGGLVGNEFDKRQVSMNAQHIPLQKIAEMGKEGLPGDVIISEIQRTKSKYQLTAEIINYLKSNNVPDKVIDYMLTTAKG